MRLRFDRSLTGILSTFACAGAVVFSLWPSGVDVRTDDQNRDSRPDVWREYDSRGELAKVAIDTNFDGRSDVEEYYQRGALTRRESDRDFNDQVDLVQEFDATTGASVRSVTDVDFDGVADLLVLFDQGRPVYSDWKHTDTPPEAAATRPRRPRRASNDRLGSFQDPFKTDLAVRMVRQDRGPADYIGTARAGGWFTATRGVASPRAPASSVADITVSLPQSIAATPYSPRGPPASRLLS